MEEIKVFEDMISFALSAVEKQLDTLNSDIKKLRDSMNKIISLGSPVPDSLKRDIMTKENEKKKLTNDMNLLKKVLNNIQLQKSSSLPVDQKIENIKKIVSPIFTKYRNVYNATVTDVNLSKGESLYHSIIKKTEVYSKLDKKIDKAEAKLNKIVAKGIIKGKENNPDKKYNRYEDKKTSVILKKSKLEHKKIVLGSKQRLVMLKRQEYINKRNSKISKLEAEKNFYISKGETGNAMIVNEKINNLKDKPIKYRSATAILLKERFVSLFTARKHRFDENGEYDDRNWAEKRIEDLEKKEARKL